MFHVHKCVARFVSKQLSFLFDLLDFRWHIVNLLCYAPRASIYDIRTENGAGPLILTTPEPTRVNTRVGSGVVRINGPAPFSVRMSYKATKPGLALSVVYLSMFYCNVVY